VITVGTLQGQAGERLTSTAPDLRIEFLGVPVKSLSLLSSTVVEPSKGLQGDVLITTHSTREGKVILFNPSSGDAKYFSLHGAQGAWALAWPGRGEDEVYIGTHHRANLFRLSLRDGQITDLGFPFAATETGGKKRGEEFIWSLTFASDGKVYGGTYPGGKLFSYDPAAGEYHDLGAIVEGEKYVRALSGDFPGRLYIGVGSHAELVVYDLASGRKRSILPEKYKGRAFVYHLQRLNHFLIAAVVPEPVILIFDSRGDSLVKEILTPAGEDGLYFFGSESIIPRGEAIYFGTSPTGNLYEYDLSKGEVTKVADGLGGPFGLAADRYVFCRTAFDEYLIYDLAAQSVVLRRPAHFEGEGLPIASLTEGPDGKLYGGAFMNQHVFSYDPRAGNLHDLGPSVSFGGQVSSLCSVGGRIYLGHYVKAQLSVYDPKTPWRPGPGREANPRVIGSVDNDQDRIPAMTLGPDGKLYLGTRAAYGKLGGSLTVFDPTSESFTVHRNIVEAQDVHCLTTDGQRSIYAGCSKEGGLGAQIRAKEAHLFVWDVEAQAKVFETIPVDTASYVNSLSVGKDGLIYGSADSTFFIFDPAKREVIWRKDPGFGDLTNVVASWDGFIYGTTARSFYRFDPRERTFGTIAKLSGESVRNLLLETKEGELYLAAAEKLYHIRRQRSKTLQ